MFLSKQKSNLKREMKTIKEGTNKNFRTEYNN